MSKRSTGWFNLRYLGRGHRFREADVVLACLAVELRQRRPDHIIFSGDATALGFEEEIARAAALLGATGSETLPGLAVPGNHDYYTSKVALSGLFERYFAVWQHGERVDGARYPFAQRVGSIWLIGVNSSTGNRMVWDASGAVGQEQLTRLARLLDRLDPGPRILVTHYPIRIANGAREKFYHSLRDLDALVTVAEQGGICLWLHGHRHTPYHFASTAFAPFPVICVGSATESGKWSYAEYLIQGRQLQALRRVYSAENKGFQDVDAFVLSLGCSS